MAGKPLPSYVDAKSITGVTFNNVSLSGKSVSSKKDLDFKVLKNEIKDLKFSK